MRSRAAAVALAVAVLVVLAADVSVVVARRTDGSGGGGASGAVRAELEAVLPELMAFVEQTRGLRFKERPQVELLDDDEFEDMLLEGEGPDEESLADEQSYLGFLRALGLIEGDVDLDEVGQSQASDIVGFYDTQAEKLFVRGTSINPYVELVLVHELTHALEDQHFDLERPDLEDDDGAAFAALVEGSALVVEQRWFDTRSEAEQAQIEQIEGFDLSGGLGGLDGLDLADEFDVFDELLSFPYDVGPRFVNAVLQAGQQARLDDAFRAPPATSEHVIHPERYLAGEGARSVPEPSPDGRAVERGTLGELGLVLVLEGALERNAALRAAAGWGGDQYVVWNDGAQTCLRWNLVMDTARDTNEVVAALRAWVADRASHASVRGADPVVVTSCG